MMLSPEQQGQRLGENPMANRRHITVDNIAKVIYLQVMFTIKGDVKYREYYDIKNGQWWKYVPDDLRDQFRQAVNGGFTVVPVVINGMCNEEFYIEQVIDIQENKIIQLTA